MGLPAADLSRLSHLLDEALDLALPEREAWLARLSADAVHLGPVLRELLARHGSKETDDLLERGPSLTAPDDTDAEPAFKPGDAVGPYKLLREVGHGGMGEVWLAERSDGQLKRSVALKLPMLGARRSVLVQRFARERDILGGLAHPHIARLYDAGLADDGQPYLALEYVEGKPITAYCNDNRLDTRARVQLLLQVMEAVQYAHANLVIHRDLKPSNVLVTAQGQAMLLDFGIAKLLQPELGEAAETELTQLGGRALTLDYAAPEQVSGAPISIATDVHALGVLLYELLSGQRPFRGTRREIEQAVLTLEPPKPKALPADLATIVLKSLKKVPSERYATANALAEDLGRWLHGEAVLAQPDSAWYRARKFIVRHRLAAGAGAAISLAVVAGAGIALWQAHVAQQHAHQAEEVTSFLLDLVASTDPDQGRTRSTTTVEMLLAARARIDARFASEPEIRVRLLSAVGYSLLGLNETEASITLFEAAIDVADRALPPDHREALVAQVRLGEALLTASRTQKAREPLAHGLAGLRRIDDVPALINALRWTSRMHSQLREPDAAIAAGREAVHLARTRLGPEQLQSALNAENELLTALQIARRGGQLEPARRAHQLIEAMYPDRVVRARLTAREAYGTALVGEGDAAEGVRLLRSAYEDAKTLFGPRDRMRGYFAGRLMIGQQIVGDMAGALESARLARRIWVDTHGERLHSDLAFGTYYEGGVLLALHRFAEAEPVLAEGVQLFERIQGPGSRVAAIARSALATARARLGDLAGAEAVIGPAPDRLSSFEDAVIASRVGLLLHLRGRSADAAVRLRAAIDYVERTQGDRFTLAAFRTALAAVIADQGAAGEAKSLAQAALATYAVTQPGSSPMQSDAWEALARAELELGNAKAALEAAGKAAAYWQATDPSTAAAARAALVEAQALVRDGQVDAAGAPYGRALAAVASLRTDPDRRLLVQTAVLMGREPPRGH